MHRRGDPAGIAAALGSTGQFDAIMATSICIPCDMPYVNNIWLPRKRGDRPPVVPEGVDQSRPHRPVRRSSSRTSPSRSNIRPARLGKRCIAWSSAAPRRRASTRAIRSEGVSAAMKVFLGLAQYLGGGQRLVRFRPLRARGPRRPLSARGRPLRHSDDRAARSTTRWRSSSIVPIRRLSRTTAMD